MPKSRWISCQLDDDERDRDRQEHGHGDVEAIAREPRLFLRPHARVPPRAVVAIAKLDRRRVDRDFVLVWRGRCHPPQCRRPVPAAILPAAVVVHPDTQASAVPDEALQAPRACGRRRAACDQRSQARSTTLPRRHEPSRGRTSRSSGCRPVRMLETVAVAGPSALAAELDGTRLAARDVPRATVDGSRRRARRSPLRRRPRGGAFRARHPRANERPSGDARAVSRRRAVRAGRAISPPSLQRPRGARAARVRSVCATRASETLVRPALELAGDALAAALGDHSAAEVVRVAASVVGAPVGIALGARSRAASSSPARTGSTPAPT